jgi:hypothetical protein
MAGDEPDQCAYCGCDEICIMLHKARRNVAMNAADVQKRILEVYGIRVETRMGEYVLSKLDPAGRALRKGSIVVMGGHARTGVPLRQSIRGEQLTSAGGETLFQ